MKKATYIISSLLSATAGLYFLLFSSTAIAENKHATLLLMLSSERADAYVIGTDNTKIAHYAMETYDNEFPAGNGKRPIPNMAFGNPSYNAKSLRNNVIPSVNNILANDAITSSLKRLAKDENVQLSVIVPAAGYDLPEGADKETSTRRDEAVNLIKKTITDALVADKIGMKSESISMNMMNDTTFIAGIVRNIKGKDKVCIYMTTYFLIFDKDNKPVDLIFEDILRGSLFSWGIASKSKELSKLQSKNGRGLGVYKLATMSKILEERAVVQSEESKEKALNIIKDDNDNTLQAINLLVEKDNARFNFGSHATVHIIGPYANIYSKKLVDLSELLKSQGRASNTETYSGEDYENLVVKTALQLSKAKQSN